MSEYDLVDKSNFHLHITGSHSVEEMRSVAEFANISIDEFEPLDGQQSFDSYDFWAVAKEITSESAGLLKFITNILDKEKKNFVSYVELTVNPFGMLRRGMSVDEIVTSLGAGFNYGQNIGVDLRVKFGVNRKDGNQSIPNVVAVYSATPDHIRYGIDLNGDERLYPTDDFVPDFRALGRYGIKTTIHAGEHQDMAGSLITALDAKPTRIAHAIAIVNSNYALQKLIDSNSPVELSLTSNLMLEAVPNMAYHPVSLLITNEVPIVFGTDDPGLFNNSMSTELLQLEVAGYSEADVLELNRNANTHRNIK